MLRSPESIDGSEPTTSSIPSAWSFYGSLHIDLPLDESLHTDPPLRRVLLRLWKWGVSLSDLH